MAEWYEILIPVASLITASVALGALYFLRKQMKISEKASNRANKSYLDSKKSYELDVVFRLNNRFYSQPYSSVRNRIASKKPVLKENGGTIDRFDFYNYLDALNEVWIFVNTKILTEGLAVQEFGAMAAEFGRNPEAMKILEHQREIQGHNVWGGILILIKKCEEQYQSFKVKEGKNSKLKKKVND